MAHFVVKYLDIFLQMECDVQKMNIQIPARPASQSPADLVALREAYAKQKIDVYETDTVAKMREASKGRGVKTVTFNNYILDRRGPHDWRDSKNPTRDHPRIALLSFVEPFLIKKYRNDLLQKSPAARYLRGSAQKLLNRFAKPRQIIKASTKKLQLIRRYEYPDGIKSTTSQIEPVDVDDLLLELSDSRNLVAHLDLLKATIKKLENLPFAFARPDATLLAPDVKEKTDSLCEVRIISRFLYPVFHITVAIIGIRGQHLPTFFNAQERKKLRPDRPA
jgi:hypothetical protein